MVVLSQTSSVTLLFYSLFFLKENTTLHDIFKIEAFFVIQF